jgi:hypothetical protein
MLLGSFAGSECCALGSLLRWDRAKSAAVFSVETVIRLLNSGLLGWQTQIEGAPVIPVALQSYWRPSLQNMAPDFTSEPLKPSAVIDTAITLLPASWPGPRC